MDIDKTELVAGSIGALGTLGFAEILKQGIAQAYQPGLDHMQQMGAKPCFELTIKGLGVVGDLHAEHMALTADKICKALEASRDVGMSTGFWVGLSEVALNFYRGWLGKGERPFAVDIVEGGLRGSAIGFGIAWFSNNPAYRGVQMATSTTFGFALGMLSAFVGSISGAIMHSLFHEDQEGEKNVNRSVDMRY